MSARCVVTDLDRTLTGLDLVLDKVAVERIRALRAAGVRVVVATGRRYDHLASTRLMDEVDGFVAENGAILAIPGQDLFRVLHPDFAARASAVLDEPRIKWGRVVGSAPREIAGWIGERLGAAGIPHTLEFNAEEVMVLPEGVDKASGAQELLALLGIAAEEAWAIGDGENDAAMLRWAGVGAAPANAVPAAKEAADVLLTASYAEGFLELTEPLLAKR